MILVNFFIGFFAIFISPQIYLYFKYSNTKYSLTLVYGLIISFTASWIIFLLLFYFNGHTKFIHLLTIFIFAVSLVYLFKKWNMRHNHNISTIWIITIVVMFPLLLHIGDGFTSWDAVVSWNRWASELFNNEYHPMRAAYPILLPSLWSLVYKIQGTDQIWWTAQITLFVIPVSITAILSTLYNEYKDKAFLFILILLYPYAIWSNSISGYMDMPVMLMGTLSLILIYAAEINKEEKEFEYYIYGALLIAGIASIIKQAGLAFLVFDIIYILLHIKQFQNKKRIFFFILLSLLYFISFLLLYYHYQSSALGNLNTLQKLSHQRAFEGKELEEITTYLWDKFFSYPPNISWLNSLVKPLDLQPITPYIILLGLLAFGFRNLRKYTSVSFLSAIFFLVGTIVWVRYFSYDQRNSYWVKSFFIIFVSINVSYLFTKYIQKISIKYFIGIFILLILWYLHTIGDNYAYTQQEKFQKNVGNKNIAKRLSKLLKGKDECVVLYTNNQPVKYNYYTKDVSSRIYKGSWYVSGLLSKLDHSCKDGRYILFGPWTKTRKNTGWEKIKGLEQSGKIIRIDKKLLLYFVPEKTKRIPK